MTVKTYKKKLSNKFRKLVSHPSMEYNDYMFEDLPALIRWPDGKERKVEEYPPIHE